MLTSMNLVELKNSFDFEYFWTLSLNQATYLPKKENVRACIFLYLTVKNIVYIFFSRLEFKISRRRCTNDGAYWSRWNKPLRSVMLKYSSCLNEFLACTMNKPKAKFYPVHLQYEKSLQNMEKLFCHASKIHYISIAGFKRSQRSNLFFIHHCIPHMYAILWSTCIQNICALWSENWWSMWVE